MSASKSMSFEAEVVAGNGLLHRRLFLAQSAAVLGAGGVGFLTAGPARAQTPPAIPPWMKSPGPGMSGYGQRSEYEHGVQRIVSSAPGTTGAGVSWTPLERLEGTITPNSLHFERHHSGVPPIDPAQHRLLIHGMVERPLLFDMDSLFRYPMVTRIQFLECSGNSAAGFSAQAVSRTCGNIHGLISCSEWTGVPLAILLEEAGAAPTARWVLAEGADAAAMARSIPIAKALDDAVLAIYQNGERLRPDNGYPLRLFLPGYEGNMSVKWLRRLKLIADPGMTRDETSKYTDTLPDGRSRMFTFPMEVKSVITSPSAGLSMRGPGLYEVSGLAWSGMGKIRTVEVSVDGGRTWGEAALSEPVLPKAMTRFRIPWRWNGGPAVIQSRATDATGTVQPTRERLLEERGSKYFYHYNAIQSWAVSPNDEITNVYA